MKSLNIRPDPDVEVLTLSGKICAIKSAAKAYGDCPFGAENISKSNNEIVLFVICSVVWCWWRRGEGG